MKTLPQSQLVRLAVLILLVAGLSIRRDGFFPFPDNIDAMTWAWMLVVQVVAMATLIYIFFKPQSFLDLIDKVKLPQVKHPEYFLVALSGGLTLFILTLHLSASRTFSTYFHLSIGESALFAVTVLPMLLIPLLLKKAKLALFTLFAVSFILLVIPIMYYQITANTADLLPVILKQLEAFTHGQNIYQYFQLDNGVLTQAVRQPGTTLSFLPAYLIGADIRWMTVIYTLLTGLVLTLFAYPKLKGIKFDRKFLITCAAIALFLLFPYRHARHDLYEPFYWLLITSSLYLLYLKKVKLFVVVWAIGIFTQVWFWLFTPFVAVYLWKTSTFKRAAMVMIPTIALGAALLAIFILRDSHAYAEHVFGFYANEITKNAYAASTIHLTPLIEVSGLGKLLTPIQFLATAAIGLMALLRTKRWQHLIGFLCAAFFVFVQFNSVSWNYMYIGLVLLMIISFLTDLHESQSED